MTGLQIIHTLFSFLPFAVCLFWAICFMAQWRRNDAPKRFMTGYLVTCVALYLFHGLFFTLHLPYAMECLWTLCSLSVYPLFYGYLCRLTSSDYTVRQLLIWLVPGALVAAAKYVFPDAGIDLVRLLLFCVQIVIVCRCGILKLKAFDRKLHAVYADTEGRDTTAVHQLLVLIIIVSVLSGMANTVGKQFFGESLWLLVAISLAFSSVQFALGYICFCRNFSIDQLVEDENEGNEESKNHDKDHTEENFRKLFEKLMVEDHYFLKHDLKIGDVVKILGSNRTYVSSYINTTYNCSFSDYMNRLRVEYAERLLASAPHNTKLSQIAEESGFASEASFYRNFKKFAGMTPSDWQRHAHDASAKE